MTLKEKPFENIEGRGENAGNQHFLLFPRFLPYPMQISIFDSRLNSCLQNFSIWTSRIFCRLPLVKS